METSSTTQMMFLKKWWDSQKGDTPEFQYHYVVYIVSTWQNLEVPRKEVSVSYFLYSVGYSDVSEGSSWIYVK